MNGITVSRTTARLITIALAVVLALAFSLTVQSAGSGTSGRCAKTVQPALSNDTNVYQLSVPFTANICVSYAPGASGTWTITPGFGPLANSSYSDCGVPNFNGTGTQAPGCQGLAISASPSPVFVVGGRNTTVEYKIATSNGLKQGIYWLFIRSCDPIILAVGPVPAHISTFALGEALSCIVSSSNPPSGQVVGVSNVTVVSVPAG